LFVRPHGLNQPTRLAESMPCSSGVEVCHDFVGQGISKNPAVSDKTLKRGERTTIVDFLKNIVFPTLTTGVLLPMVEDDRPDNEQCKGKAAARNARKASPIR
jgi:hypothetical protein